MMSLRSSLRSRTDDALYVREYNVCNTYKVVVVVVVTTGTRWRAVTDWTEFLRTYYRDEMAETVMSDDKTIQIDWSDIRTFDEDAAYHVLDDFETAIADITDAIHEYTVDPIPEPTPLTDASPAIVNVGHSPIVTQLRSEHMGQYIGVRGQVGLTSQVLTEMQDVTFECQRCGDVTTITNQIGSTVTQPNECPTCERNGPFVVQDAMTTDRDHQIVELTDPPGENPGATNDRLRVDFYDDLAGTVNPGDRVQVYGVLEREPLEGRNPSLRREWQLEARAVETEAAAFNEVEPERIDEIKALSERDDLVDRLVDSFAPAILTGERGDNHKLALLLALFGGSSSTDRDDINVFIVGAPGTGKSHYLQRAAAIAPKAVKASGKGASAAGLTASASQSEHTGKWMLDPGALVLASGGVACIDEFDKMSTDARKSMHEAMEEQEVPINKAGINTTLTTKTTVIAAANPTGGQYDQWVTLSDQLDLDAPILSRFDLIFGVNDQPDPDRDRAIARHQHVRAGRDGVLDRPVDDELLTQYIAYARQTCHPTYPEDSAALDRLVEYYPERRQQSESNAPIQARTNDALRRLAQASARMHLRDTILPADAELAIELYDMTLGDTALDDSGSLDGAKREGRQHSWTQKKRRTRIPTLVEELSNGDGGVKRDDLLDEASSLGMDRSKVTADLEHLRENGTLYNPRMGVYRTA